MNSAHSKTAKLFAIMLAVIMTLSVIPLADISPKAEAFTTFGKNWATEYYYPAGTAFVKNIAICYYKKGDEARNAITNIPCTLVNQDLTAGTGGDYYVYMGYNTTTDPTAANACKGIRITYNSSEPDVASPTTFTYTSSVSWYKCNTGYNATYSPKLHGDGAVDLNRGCGSSSDDMKLYATYDRSFGPAISIIQCTSGSSYRYKNSTGWSDVIDFSSGSVRDCNQGAGGDYLYLHYYTPCSAVNTTTLRANYTNGLAYYNNSARYLSVLSLSDALTTAQSILSDVNDGYTTYTQAQINSAATAITNAINGLQTYVYFSANGGTLGAGTATQTLTIGGSSTYSLNVGSAVASRTGFTFSGWSTSNTASTGSKTTVSVGFMTTLYAVWTRNSYYLDLNGWLDGASSGGLSPYGTADVTISGYTSVSSNDVSDWNQQILYQSNYSITDIKANAGYKYIGVKSGALSGTMGTSNISTMLEFATTSVITLNNQSATTAGTASVTGVYGYALPSISVPSRNGYTFGGYYTGTNGTGTQYYNASGTGVINWNLKAATTLYAKWTAIPYTIRFLNYDGSVLQTTTMYWGNTPSYTGATPQKPSTVSEVYTFFGWNPTTLTAVTGSKDYTATFSTAVRPYTIKFVNSDGTVLQNSQVNYGTVPVYNGATPTKTATAQYTYTFKSWDSAPAAVTGDKTYTATYNNTVNEYTVTFKNYDGSVLQTLTGVPYGTIPSYSGTTPLKPQNTSTVFTHNGWSPAVTSVTGNAVYVATYGETARPYIISFVNDDDTVLQSSSVPYGTVPVYSGATPTKAATAQYTYTFNTWDTTPSAVTGDKTYKATYNSTVNKYTVTFENYDGTVLQTIENIAYGETPVYTEATPVRAMDIDKVYTFGGWNVDIEAVTGNKTYTATFDDEVRTYSIKFNNYNGTTLYTVDVPYGTVPTYAGSTPLKPADVQYTYTFSTWTPALTSVTNEATYTAEFSSVVNKYEVSFYDEDGTTLLYKADFDYGTVPAYDTENLGEPTKEADSHFSYSFSKWTPAITTVTGTASYKAEYSSLVNQYLIKFNNADGTTLKSYTLDYGTTPVYDGYTPTKAADAQYTYTFDKWDNEIEDVTGNKTYTATYTSTVNSYEISFVNYNGDLLNKYTLDYGTVPTYTGETPLKPQDAQFTYSFKSWDITPVEVTGNATYTAVYNNHIRSYTVVFKAEDGSTLDEQVLDYGTMPVYAGETPTKAATAQFSYTYSGWTPNLEEVTGEAEYTVTFDSTVNEYEITFENENGDVLQKTDVPYGTVPVYTGSTPLKAADVQYSYTFNTWDTEIVAVTGAATYTATYNSQLNPYEITFENFDGTILQQTNVLYGDTPVYNGLTPEKAEDAQYFYEFDGWNETVSVVSGAKTYTAVYESILRDYTITFKNEDGTVLQNTKFYYGELPVYSGATPLKAADVQYTYVFDTWDTEIETVTGEATYTATYNNIVNKYTIIFKNENGDILQEKSVEYGTVPTYDGTTPQKTETAQYFFEFNTWDKEIVSVTGDAAYTATYNNILRSYVITFVNEDGTMLDQYTVDYGTTPVYVGVTPTKEATPKYSYTFDTWAPDVNAVSGTAIYTATYTSKVNKYLITFYDENGTTVLDEQYVEYDVLPVYAGITPTKARTAQYTYTFAGFNPQITTVTGDASYVAGYSATVNQYKVKFVNYDNSLVAEYTLDYGQYPVYTISLPTKPRDAQYTWHFDKWDNEFSMVTGNQTYKAEYYGTINSYAITFVNYDNGELYSAVYEYGQTPVYTGEIPTKPENKQFYYRYNGFGEIATVTGAAVYTAQYDEIVKQYKIQFVDSDGTVLQSEMIDYGTTPIYSAPLPSNKNTATGHYAFDNWNRTITPVTGKTVYTAVYKASAHELSSVSNPASCTSNGSVVYSCGLCNYTHTVVIPATGHNYISVTDEEGNVTKTCQNCGDEIFIPAEEIPDSQKPVDVCEDCGHEHGQSIIDRLICSIRSFAKAIMAFFSSIG